MLLITTCPTTLKTMVSSSSFIFITVKFYYLEFIKYKMLFILVHRIGRTGRSGHVGRATTFINKSNDESVLLDLKHLLLEAKQKIPPFLLELCSENEKYNHIVGGTNIFLLFL